MLFYKIQNLNTTFQYIYIYIFLLILQSISKCFSNFSFQIILKLFIKIYKIICITIDKKICLKLIDRNRKLKYSKNKKRYKSSIISTIYNYQRNSKRYCIQLNAVGRYNLKSDCQKSDSF